MQQLNAPCHYRRLYSLLVDNGYTLEQKTFCSILRHGIDNGYITRSPVAGNVLYAITSEGKQLLYRFAMELDRIVAERCREYGNGMNLE